MYQYTTRFYAYSTYFFAENQEKNNEYVVFSTKNLYVIFLNLNVFSAKNIKFIGKQTIFLRLAML